MSSDDLEGGDLAEVDSEALEVGDGVRQQAAQPVPSAKAMRDAIRMTALGNATWLMSRSAIHKHLFFADAEWLLMPPIVLNQYRLWMVDGVPRGFATWALVSPDVEARLSDGTIRLSPTDWKSGNQAWLIDLIAPFGGGEVVRDSVLNGPLAGREVKVLGASIDGARQVQTLGR